MVSSITRELIIIAYVRLSEVLPFLGTESLFSLLVLLVEVIILTKILKHIKKIGTLSLEMVVPLIILHKIY